MGRTHKQLPVEKKADSLKKEMIKEHLNGMSFIDNDGVKFEVKFLSRASLRKFFNKDDLKRIFDHRTKMLKKHGKK